MRLIDADYILSALGVFTSEEPESAHFMNGIKTAREIVEDAPTVEEQEPVPAVEVWAWYECYKCGSCDKLWGKKTEIERWNFCPWCGRGIKWDAAD